MSKFQHILTAIVVAAVFCVSLAGVSVAGTNESKDLNTISCKDIMRLSGGDRDISMGVIHGYLLGKKGTSKYKSDRLAEATDEFIETCLDNPKAMAIKTMEAILKKAQ
jgi:hypothetical protein